MKVSARYIKRGEVLVYLIIWLVVFLMPVFMSGSGYRFNWQRIGFEWLRILPFLLIFILHNFVFFPLLFFKNRRIAYFLVTFLTIVLISLLWVWGDRFLNSRAGIMPEPPPGRFLQHQNLPFLVRPWFVNLSNSILVSVLVVGFNAAIKLTTIWQDEEQKNRILEKEKLQAELAFLRNQVSPHFFMNTLNNIHALIDVDGKNAKESIVKLSRLMRYLLYDSDKGETTLQKEVEFIKNYVDLMKLRVVSDVNIELSFPEKITEVRIPPLLFVSLVENAFKYGVSYREKSFIGIFIRLKENKLYFRITNSNHRNKSAEVKGGLGLKNLKKRLELIYGSNFLLETSKDDDVFETHIILPVYGNQMFGN